ncbi:hypothetical protein LCGC14_0357730 [marine sediment metagenome]|uniref:Uncharacterized protein n=1 Tax=marine sediment metagenome TaxID=412755 RepID=A0A0F9WGX8_9ZZZZ
MKYRTKQSRLQATMRKFVKVHKVHSFTTQEVSAWMIRMGLFPIPKRGDPKELCEEWESNLDSIGKHKLPNQNIVREMQK